MLLLESTFNSKEEKLWKEFEDKLRKQDMAYAEQLMILQD